MDLRPPNPDVYAAAGGPVALNNPLTTCVVAGSRITIVRSFIGFWQRGQAQPGAPSAVVRKDSPLEPARPVPAGPPPSQASTRRAPPTPRRARTHDRFAGVEVATFSTTSVFCRPLACVARWHPHVERLVCPRRRDDRSELLDELQRGKLDPRRPVRPRAPQPHSPVGEPLEATQCSLPGVRVLVIGLPAEPAQREPALARRRSAVRLEGVGGATTP